MDSKVDTEENLEKNPKEAADDTIANSTKSHSVVNPINRVKQDNLRNTKSSPHRNVELHHTRSFSEIFHLHPSHTDVSSIISYPKPRAITDLQHEVRRPESVLELSDLTTSSEEESDEDLMTTQRKGDEAMKIFLEANVSIPLDGNMTSSSLSQDTLDSDIASESEVIVGNWDREKRDSLSSNGSSLTKRFLTPSGQLLFREHQVDSMLDTKRLKLTPSSSDRPMSPLATRRSGDHVRCDDTRNERGYMMISDSESDDLNEEHLLDKDDEDRKMQRQRCGCDPNIQDLKQVIRKYERQFEELRDRNKEQYDEIKYLRKDNANMHKEHSRLQVVIRECHQNEDSLKGNFALISKEKDAKIVDFGQRIEQLGSNLQDKNSEITQLQNNITNHVQRGQKYVKVMQDIHKEICALFKTLAKELGFDDKFEVDLDENPEAIVAMLRTRRQSLSEDFKKHYEQFSDKNTVGDIQNRMKRDFQEISSGFKENISKIQKAEKDLGTVLKRSASLETLLKEIKRNHARGEDMTVLRKADFRADIEVKLEDLKRRNDSLLQQNGILQDDCSKWKHRCKEIVKRNEINVRRNPRDEKPQASVELEKLQKYLKQRRRCYSETELSTLQNYQVTNFARTIVNEAETKLTKGQLESVSFEENSNSQTPKLTNETMAVTQKSASNSDSLSDLEKRLKQLSQLTESLSQKIETSSQSFVMKRAEKPEIQKEDLMNSQPANPMLLAFYGEKLFSVIKEIYNEHLITLQDANNIREQECRYLREQLLAKQNNEEITRYHMESLKRAIAFSQEDLGNCKKKNQDLKRELRMLKDQALVTNTEREMSLFYCKKNVIVDGGSEVETSEQRRSNHGFNANEETSRFGKQLKHTEV